VRYGNPLPPTAQPDEVRAAVEKLLTTDEHGFFEQQRNKGAKFLTRIPRIGANSIPFQKFASCIRVYPCPSVVEN
jgi:hypothetical protein